MTTLDQALSSYEISMLNNFLKNASIDTSFTKDICWFDGYLCAINNSVELIAPSEWINEIINENFTFESIEQAETITPLAMKLHDGIDNAVRNKTYIPIYNWHNFNNSEDASQLELSARWAKGYLLGNMMVNEELLELDEVKVALMPIVISSGVVPDKELEKDDLSRIEMVAKIPRVVQVMSEFRNIMRERND